MSIPFTQVRKRDGSIEPFDPAKIQRAITKAHAAIVGQPDDALDRRIAERALHELAGRTGTETPSVEEIQDAIERALIDADCADIAKAFILYRSHHQELREAKRAMGIRDDLKLSLNAIRILDRRYLARDERGRTVETPSQLFRRVADAIAAPEAAFDGDPAATAEAFYRMMASLDFLPNSPTLMNAGRDIGQLSACFVLPVEDSMEGIFDAVKYMALIHQSGGGTGFAFSRLRPRGARVKSTGGIASGPVSFMHVFDRATDVIKQGGRRRGANMAILRVDHPDVREFVLAKATHADALRNFNVSVAATEAFMKAVHNDSEYALRNPASGGTVRTLPAREIFQLVAQAAWQCGDPGMVFVDEINRHNPLAAHALIESTNPCGEQPLLPFESCNLGSINLLNFTTGEGLDYDRLGETVDMAVRFLDNVIEANRFPLEQVREATLATRKIGLGVMGFADTLYRLGIPYDSEDGLRFGEEVMAFVNDRAHAMSERLGGKRGAFPLFDRSDLNARGFEHLRNATCTTVAPTGTIGLIAGVSSGIEPVFALRYWRRMAEGTLLIETHPYFQRVVKDRGLDPDALFSDGAAGGSVQQCRELPAALRRVFVTARDIAPEWHVRMQAAFQKHVDNGVSKTVNLPAEATVADVDRIYRLAYELGCKGITVYREGSREEDLLHAGNAANHDELPSCDLQDVLEGIEDSGTRCRCP